jgi:hypothetical protein
MQRTVTSKTLVPLEVAHGLNSNVTIGEVDYDASTLVQFLFNPESLTASVMQFYYACTAISTCQLLS